MNATSNQTHLRLRQNYVGRSHTHAKEGTTAEISSADSAPNHTVAMGRGLPGSRPPTRQRRRCHLESSTSRARNLAAAPATIRQGRARWCERRQDPCSAGRRRRRLGPARCYITRCTSLGLGPLAPFAAPAPSTASLPPTTTLLQRNAPPLPSPTLTSCCAARSSSMRRTAALAGPRPPGGGGRLQPSRQEEAPPQRQN